MHNICRIYCSDTTQGSCMYASWQVAGLTSGTKSSSRLEVKVGCGSGWHADVSFRLTTLCGNEDQ